MDQTPAVRGYVICSEHRSGSTLLCELLKSTGQLGNPDEFFRDTIFSARFERRPEFLENVLDQATTPNGIYGLKVFSQQFDVTCARRWAEELPDLRYVYLERRDLLGQAISLVRARQTEQYSATAKARRAERYDGRAIKRQLGRIAEGYLRWRRFFARNGIVPVWLSYEELIDDHLSAVLAVARAVEIELTADVVVRAELRRQQDQLTSIWRERFISEYSDTGYLDHPLGLGRIRLRRFARDVRYWLETRRGG
jgi:trehalose 2-sulfotransferase